ncbi:conserved hypothetical protein [Paraburkholderia caribensis]|nr:conserved hypothetical protein [Paraburkholderia caribensis]
MITFYRTAKCSDATAVLGPALYAHRFDAGFAKFAMTCSGVIAEISILDVWFLKWPTMPAADRRNSINEDVMFGTEARAIRGGRASFSSTPTAHTNVESMAASATLNQAVSRNFASSNSCNRSHGQAIPHRASDAGKVEPESRLNLIDGPRLRLPALNINRMPFSTSRSENRRRFGYFLRLDFGGGNGLIGIHGSLTIIRVLCCSGFAACRKGCQPARGFLKNALL